MKEMSKKCPLPTSPLHVLLEIHKISLSLYNNFISPRLHDDEEYIQRKCGADFRLSYRRLWKDLIGNKRHNTPHSDRYGVRVRRTRPATGIYTKVSVVPFRPYDQENFHIFNKGLAKNTFTICNARTKCKAKQI